MWSSIHTLPISGLLHTVGTSLLCNAHGGRCHWLQKSLCVFLHIPVHIWWTDHVAQGSLSYKRRQEDKAVLGIDPWGPPKIFILFMLGHTQRCSEIPPGGLKATKGCWELKPVHLQTRQIPSPLIYPVLKSVQE